MNSHDQRVHEFAYQIWESEGKPEGHHHRHWEMACKLAEVWVASSASQPSPLTSTPTSLQNTPIEPVNATQANRLIQSSPAVQPAKSLIDTGVIATETENTKSPKKPKPKKAKTTENESV